MGSLRNLIIVAAMLVIGLGGSLLVIGNFQVYGMSLAAMVGIVLNFILPKEKKSKKSK
jgi:uracil permease